MGSNKKNKKSKNKNEKSKGRDENVITDSRFSSVHWDPRFQNVPKHKEKVEIDSRFSSSSVPLDKRGKPKKLNQGNSLHHYYKIEEDEDKVNSEVKKKEKKIEEEEEEESEELEELGGEESEDDVASGDSDTTTDTDTDDEYEEEEEVFEDGKPGMEAEDVPEIDKETHRLAIVNLDWRHVKAVDLHAVLRYFLPKDGEMKAGCLSI